MTNKWRPTVSQLFRAAFQILIDNWSLRRASREPVRYTSGDRVVDGAFYYPETSAASPGVLLLPTASGLTPHEHAVAMRLARHGYLTLVIGYTSRTTGAVILDDQKRLLLEKAVRDGYRLLQQHPRVAAGRISVIGLSLGGYFATMLSTDRSEDFPSATIVYYGMYPFPNEELMRHKSPLLILQGAKDDETFVANAKTADKFLRSAQKPCELVIYPEAGHQFDLFAPSSSASVDAWQRTIAFLDSHIGKASLTGSE